MTIREWLCDPSDYQAGATLYEKYGSSSSLKRLLSKSGDTPRNRETLIYELGKIIDTDTLKVQKEIFHPEDHQVTLLKSNDSVVVNFTIREKEIIYNPESEKETSAPEQVQERTKEPPGTILELEQQWKDLYKQAAHKQATLLNMSEEGRKEAAHFILESFDEIEQLWRKVDHFKVHGSLPPEEKIKAQGTDALSLAKRRANLKTYITKANKGVQYYKKEDIPGWQEEIKHIEELLNNEG